MDKLFPFGIFFQMSPEDIVSIGRGFLRNMKQSHLDFLQSPSALAMIARWTGSYYVRPDMFTAKMFGPDMVNS
jgi:hypothetical protein